MTILDNATNAGTAADFEFSSFYIGPAALSAAAHCAELVVDLRTLLPTGEGEGTFPTTRDLRRFSDLVSAATIG
jgi:hypothetical protein